MKKFSLFTINESNEFDAVTDKTKNFVKEELNINFDDWEDIANNYYLLEFSDNYADEFDIDGLVIMTGDELDEYKNRVLNIKGHIERYFGTNEFVEYNNGRDYLNGLRITEINKNEYDFLKKNVCRHRSYSLSGKRYYYFGTFIFL